MNPYHHNVKFGCFFPNYGWLVVVKNLHFIFSFCCKVTAPSSCYLSSCIGVLGTLCNSVFSCFSISWTMSGSLNTCLYRCPEIGCKILVNDFRH